MTTEVFESVWDALEDTPTEAENMKLRSILMIAITEDRDGMACDPNGGRETPWRDAASTERSAARPCREVQSRCAGRARRSRRPRVAFGNHGNHIGRVASS